jgi:hypothetical protein
MDVRSNQGNYLVMETEVGKSNATVWENLARRKYSDTIRHSISPDNS